MEIERVVDGNGRIEMWAYEWDMAYSPARKADRRLIGYEQPVRSAHEESAVVREAICWSYGRTRGNIAVSMRRESSFDGGMAAWRRPSRPLTAQYCWHTRQDTQGRAPDAIARRRCPIVHA